MKLITCADRGEYDEFAAKYNSLADDFEVFEACVDRYINHSALMNSPVRRVSFSCDTSESTASATQMFANCSNPTDASGNEAGQVSFRHLLLYYFTFIDKISII